MKTQGGRIYVLEIELFRFVVFFFVSLKLRGLTPKQVQYDANHLLKKLNMTAKANEYGHNLSGGMKRRLCLGNALIGNTK